MMFYNTSASNDSTIVKRKDSLALDKSIKATIKIMKKKKVIIADKHL